MSSDPKYIGPGYWTSWHLKSLKAKKRNEKAEVSRNIVLDIANFPCLKCREHAKEYVRNHPLLEVVNNKNEISLFEWTVNFHNTVNLRIGKDTYSLEDAMAMWSGDNSFCMEDCDQLDEKKELEEKRRKEEMRKEVEEEMKREFKEEIRKEVEEAIRKEVEEKKLKEEKNPTSRSIEISRMLIRNY